MNDKFHNSKQQSLRSLDWINFSMADIQMAAAAFVAIYLAAGLHWDPGKVGIVVGAQNIATMAAQTPVGAFIDCSRHKKRILALGATIVGVGCLIVLTTQRLLYQVVIQVVTGVASSVFPAGIAAVSLGLVGRNFLAQRVGRNEACNHAGKVVLAIVTAVFGMTLGQRWIFYVLFLYAAVAVVAALRLKSQDIDDDAAREAPLQDDTRREAPLGASQQAKAIDFIRDRRIPVFLTAVILFHFSNAGLLQMVGQVLARRNENRSSLYISGCIVVAQTVMVPLAILVARASNRWGRKPLFLLAYAFVALRAFLFAVHLPPPLLISLEALDGVSAALFGVLWTLINSDLARGTGRFNLLQGSVSAAWYLGAFLSNLGGGWAAAQFGFSKAFCALGALAAVGFFFFAVFMPETHRGTSSEVIGSSSEPSTLARQSAE
jgi:MFS family permease